MNNFQVKKSLIVFGGGLLLFWLLKPKQKKQQEVDRLTMRKNAAHALAAYKKAVAAGENASALDELNREIEKEYSLRIYKAKDGFYYAADLQGNDILRN